MRTFLLADWTTVQSAAGNTETVQSSALYLDLERYQDVTFQLDVKQVSSPAPVMKYETAPIRDDRFFQPQVAGLTQAMASFTMVLTTAATGPDIRRIRLADNPTVPLGRWVRWRITQDIAININVTFRIYVIANSLAM